MMREMAAVLILGALFIFAAGCWHQGHNISASAGGIEDPHLTDLNIQALIDGAADDDTIHIPRGRYALREGLVIEDRGGLVIRCDPGTEILVEDTNADVVAIRKSEDIRIENAYLRHVKPLEEYECHGDVVEIRDSEGVTLYNCELDGCGAIGVSAWNSKRVTVQNCLIRHNTFNAIYLHGCDEVRIESCVIEDNANSMQAYEVDDLMMLNNIIQRNAGYWGEKDASPGLNK